MALRGGGVDASPGASRSALGGVDARSRLGRFGESVTAQYYEAEGFVVLDRNWRCREGELDLVLGRGRLVVFCEVKTRRGSGYGTPAEAVTRDKQRKLRASALAWLQAHRGRYETRFDVASVEVTGGVGQVELITHAF